MREIISQVAYDCNSYFSRFAPAWTKINVALVGDFKLDGGFHNRLDPPGVIRVVEASGQAQRLGAAAGARRGGRRGAAQSP